MSIKIVSSNITLTIQNDATGERIIKSIKKNYSIGDVINELYRDGFLVKPPANFYWECHCNNKVLGLIDKLGPNLNSGEILLFCCKEYDPCNEITVKIVKAIGGADCDIAVPVGATIGDVIVGLMNEGFLEDDTCSATTVLYNIDADGGISSGVEYDDRSKTVKEYGWYEGQTLIAVFVIAD